MLDFAKILKNVLDEKGVSQKWLAKQAKTTEATISRFVNEKRKPSALETLSDISLALNVSTDYLLGLTPIKNYDFKVSAEEAILLSALRKSKDAEYFAIVTLLKQHMTPVELCQLEKFETDRKKGIS